MTKINTAIITERLGGPPESWTFAGQCFQAGEQSQLKCALLQQSSQYFFTLKRIDGSPGRRYIGFEAIPYFRYRNRELYRRLNGGVALLEMQSDEFDRQAGCGTSTEGSRCLFSSAADNEPKHDGVGTILGLR